MSIYKRTYNNRNQWRFKVGYKDVFGTSHRKCSKWYNSKAECKKAEASFLAHDSQHSEGIKFEEVALDWAEYSGRNNTEKTKKEKIMFINHFYLSLHGLQIQKITAPVIRKMLEDPGITKLSTARKNRIHGYLKAIFHHAVVFYSLPKNPMDVIPRFKLTPSEKMKEMNIYTPEQFKVFLGVIPNKYIEYKRLFYVLYWTGMRLNECKSLVFSDVLPGSINLWRQYVDGQWAPLKTAGSKRKIAVDPSIDEIIRLQYEKYKDAPSFDMDSWFIFGGWKQLSYTTIERVKDNAVSDSKLPYIRIHDFRHSHASYLIDKGVNMYKISKRLGHSGISITMDRYGHLMDSEEDEILQVISNEKKTDHE